MLSPIEEITDQNFEAEVLHSKQPYLLDFSAVWCPPCKALNPIIESLAEQYKGQLRVGKIDLDTSPAVAARLNVRGAPTLILFRNGRESARKLGLTTRLTLEKLIAQ
jgi:thioredoxin 1